MPLPGKQPGNETRRQDSPGRREPGRPPRRFSRPRALLVAAAVALVMGAGAAWVERLPLLAWVYVQGLSRAKEANRDVWVERVAGVGDAAVPGLLACLGRDDRRVCANVGAALGRLADGARRGGLADRLAEAFPRLSAPGQEAVLKLEAGWISAGTVSPALPRLLADAARCPDPAVRAGALEPAALLLDRPDGAAPTAACREVVQAGLRAPDPATRLRAVHLALHPRLALLEAVLHLLNDPAPEVRREAMLAARSAPDAVIKTESLLHWLHDPDEDVRRLCEAVLRGRNLSEEHLKVGRLLTDGRPAVRLQVLNYLHAGSDLEPGVWLRLLSIDPEPSVRVAAVRAAVADPRVDLSDRMDQMVQSDPSPTVSQLTRYYLSCQQQRRLSISPGERR
jgi:hypothetical protein